MSKSVCIKKIVAAPIIDSRGGEVVECHIILDDGMVASGSAPGGISTSVYEGPTDSPIDNTIQMIEQFLVPRFLGKEPNLRACDIALECALSLEQTVKQATLPLSIAVGRAEAYAKRIPYYKLLRGNLSVAVPNKTPTQLCFNVLHGGAHAPNDLDIQEILLIPKTVTPSHSLRLGTQLQHSLIRVLEEHGYATDSTNIPCPMRESLSGKKLTSDREALDLVMEAINLTGLVPGHEVTIGLDVAAGHISSRRSMELSLRNYQTLASCYPITFLEDPFAPEDKESWKRITNLLGGTIQIVGEDLFASDIDRIRDGIVNGLANGAIIKPGQTGTVSQLLRSIDLCHRHNFDIITSPRSRETRDTFVAELTRACRARQFKTIACECVFHAKKNTLLSDKIF